MLFGSLRRGRWTK